ncbi:LysE family translocator [Trinickia dabaoshanensis]|uniref:LysE family translocator n=1 Tax=Trinickia dabaoshanensis TaxID=564714 RepID=A0A2N7VJT1_9BURK|nr:LysE family translocator [Trinickia dabaoshanensis]PMS17403.1 LysE family translocator [Trinickia dabaoshanensis]
MVSLQIWMLIVGFSVPMIISPGPGNTILATAGGRFGVRGTMPFWFGFEAANFIWCLVYGFELSRVLHDVPGAAHVLKWLGIAYTIYLAYGFVKPSKGNKKTAMPRLTAIDGFLSVSLNPKIHSMIFVLFSQFLRPGISLAQQVLQITFVFTVLCIVCHFPWIYGGRVVFHRFSDEKSAKLQGYLFGGCMAAVALVLAVTV